MTEQITPSAHSSIVGGSTAARRMHCPRSYALEALVPPDTGNSYTREGTALHELMATILLDGADPLELLPFTFEEKRPDGTVDWSFTVDRDLWDDKGQPALDAFDAFVEEIETAWNQPFDFVVEQRVQFPGIPGAFGTSDIVGKCGDEVFTIDWKFGRKIVEAEGNAQIMFYTVGALHSCAEFLNANVAEPDASDRPVTGVIIQPMRGGASRWETSLGELQAMQARLVKAVDDARANGLKAAISKGPGCDFCRCKPICPMYVADTSAMVEKMQRLKERQAAATDDTAAEDAEDIALLLADMLPLADAVEEWASAVHKTAHQFAEGGTKLPGYKLVAKAPGGGRSWAVTEDDVAKFFKNRRFTLDEYMPRSLISMPQGEKLLKAQGKEVPEAMVKKPVSSGTKLVRESTDGQAVTLDAAGGVVAGIAAKLAKLQGGE